MLNQTAGPESHQPLLFNSTYNSTLYRRKSEITANTIILLLHTKHPSLVGVSANKLCNGPLFRYGTVALQLRSTYVLSAIVQLYIYVQ